ncbi:MAG: hypothetical protein GXO74_11315 [Calditrichaeota bacterium]|nr:hypothetical protein [Calditrichota bacterium]
MARIKTLTLVMAIFVFIAAVAAVAQTPKQIKKSDQLTKNAIALYQKKKYDDAKENLQVAVRLNPKNVKAHEMLSLLYYIERNFASATKQAQIAISINNKSAPGYYVLGMINYQNKEKEKARFNLTQALKYLRNPDRRGKAQHVLNNLKKNFSETKAKKPIRSKIKKKLNLSTEATPTENPGYQPYVAVFAFEESNSQAQGLGKTLSEMLTTALIQKQKFTVMERTQLEKILQEQSLSQTGVIDTEVALKVGRLAGLQAVILGNVSRLNRRIEADVRLIDVETGKALGAANGKVDDVENVRDLAKRLADDLGNLASTIQPNNEEGPDSTKTGK